MRHLMNPLDFSVDELEKLFDLANKIEADPAKYAHSCEGKKLATCFYEPSTRTRLSFEAVREKYNLGRATPVEFEQAKTNLFKVEVSRISARFEYLLRTRILRFYETNRL